MGFRRTLGPMLLLVALLAPAVLAGVVVSPASKTPPRTEALSDSSDQGLVFIRSRDAAAAPILEVHGFDGLAGDRMVLASADESVDAPRFVVSLQADALQPPETEEEPMDVHSEATLYALMSSAQGSVAALGAAVQIHSASAPGTDGLPASGAAVERGNLAPAPVELGQWSLIVFWTVFLASIGLVLVPRAWTVGFWGLYARLAKHEMEDHPRRALLLQMIRDEPGLHVEILRRRGGLAPGVVQHHLRQLLDHGLVRRVHVGRSTHWYPAGRPVVAPTSAAYRRVLAQLRERPGLSAREVADAFLVTAQAAWKTLDGLRNRGLVATRRDGRAMRWQVCGP